MSFCNFNLSYTRFFPHFLLWVHSFTCVKVVLFRLKHWVQRCSQCFIQLWTCDALAESYTSPGFPNLMANKGDIHLNMSEIVMATLSLLSLVYIDARQPFSLHSPLILPLLLPFIKGSLNRWDHLTVGVKGDVHSLLWLKKSLCELEFRAWLQTNLSLGWTF